MAQYSYYPRDPRRRDGSWQVCCDLALRLLQKAADGWYGHGEDHYEPGALLAVLLRVLSLGGVELLPVYWEDRGAIDHTLDEWLQIVASPVEELRRLRPSLDYSDAANVAGFLAGILDDARRSWVCDSPEEPATSGVLDSIIEELYRTRIVVRKHGM